MMKKQFEAIKNDLQYELASSASEYLRLGLELFHKERKNSTSNVQSIIGNLSVAIELMIKAFLATQNPSLIFTNLPLELKIFFSSPEGISQTTGWRAYELELRSFSYKTLELHESVSAFNIYFPEERQRLQAYFRLLADIRNKSLHASLPSFQKYQLERIGYLAISAFEILRPKMSKNVYWPGLSPVDKKFFESFNEKRIENVHKKIESAKQKAKKLTSAAPSISASDWEEFVTECPICKSDGMLTGITESDTNQSGPDEYEVTIAFEADGFQCEECGLILDDFEELRLAGMDTVYDRNDDIDKWFRDTEGDPHSEYY
jgi:hypothetical protein